MSISRLRNLTTAYPRQFWLLFWGILINASGSSMVWPFLTIYMRQQLNVPLTTITLLFTLNAAAGLASTWLAGPAVDRFGRKRAMVGGLLASSLILVAMSSAGSLPLWALLMLGNGLAGPIYSVGANAMVADLVPAERRAGGYALIRMISNLGIAIGPAVGGFVAGASYHLAFYIAAAAGLSYTTLLLLGVRETLPAKTPTDAVSAAAPRATGYGPVLRDRPFLRFCGLYTLAIVPAPIMMMLLAVYAKENFGVPESQYGFIMATNAIMVVAFQYIVTQWSQRRPLLRILALGGLLYALGAGSVALGRGFAAFWLSMVVLTLGELLLAPTGSAYAANSAPPDMRGRYMGLYGITWSISFGIGPVVGGWLSDNVAPSATWLGALAIGLIGTLGFVWLERRRLRVRSQPNA